MNVAQKITPCLWFDVQAEQAAEFYTSIFNNSKITSITRYSDAGHEVHQQRVGQVMTVTFELDGQRFTAVNGGSIFTFNEAVSFQLMCDTQEEVDYYWDKLASGGDEAAQQCGWLKDKYGLSWQVVPNVLIAMLNDPDATKTKRVTEVMLPMKKLDIAALQQAYDE